VNLISEVKSKRMQRKEDAKEKAEKSSTKNYLIGSIMVIISIAAVCYLIFNL